MIRSPAAILSPPMHTNDPLPKIPWLDEFNTPSTDALREIMVPDTALVFDQLYSYLSGCDDLEEDLAWYGDGWHWTITWTGPWQKEPLVLVIPAPEDLLVAMPMAPGFYENLPVRRLKRFIRDGLDIGRSPYDTRWGVWPIPSANLVKDIRHLVEQRLKYARAAAEE